MVRFSVTSAAMAAMVGLTSLLMSPTQSLAEGIEVVMHEARIIRLARAADTIIVGNPEVADATAQSDQTLVLTGVGFGVTNLVVLDADGNPIVDERIKVKRADANTVRVYRQTRVQTLSCTPRCETAYRSQAEIESEEAAAASQ